MRMDVKNLTRASLVAQRLKRLPPMRETRVRSLGREDPLEKEMATCSSILAWKIPRTEEPDGLQSMGSQKNRTRLSTQHSQARRTSPFPLPQVHSTLDSTFQDREAGSPTLGPLLPPAGPGLWQKVSGMEPQGSLLASVMGQKVLRLPCWSQLHTRERSQLPGDQSAAKKYKKYPSQEC